MSKNRIGIVLLLLILNGCADSTVPPSGNANGNTNVIGSPSSNPSGTTSSKLAGDVYYTGYDGGANDLSILIRTSRKLEIVDASVATATLNSIDIPQETVDAMINELKAVETVSPQREQRLRNGLATAKAWKIVPLKAGTTLIKATRFDRDGVTIHPESVWYNAEYRTLVVSSYTPALIQSGETRYLNGGGGSPSCASCHTNPLTGAPAHKIGRVTEISDIDAISWISKGQAGDRSDVSHAWLFTDENEKLGTVAFLRTQQTDDVAELAKLLFAEVLAEAKAENVQ